MSIFRVLHPDFCSPCVHVYRSFWVAGLACARDQKITSCGIRRSLFKLVWLALASTILVGCGSEEPQATVQGTLRLKGKPLDNCLVTFLPENRQQEDRGPHSSGLTDGQGNYRLRTDNQEEGSAVGPHRVTVQDLSVSTGVRRLDHGTVDAEQTDRSPPRPPQRSRVPSKYTSPATTPLLLEVRPGEQTIDLDVR